MATIIKHKATKSDIRKLGSRIAFIVTEDVTDVIAETIVTVSVYGMTMAVMNAMVHPYFLTFVPGLYSLAMIAAWGIRFVRHFDSSATNNELRDQIDERFAELETKMTERLDYITNNMVP